MSTDTTVNRLMEERKQWRLDHPYGFFARPKTIENSTNMMIWDCGILGKPGGLWEGIIHTLTLTFPKDYPSKPPKCVFYPVLPHPNVYPSGTICLGMLGDDWKSTYTIKDILLDIQDLLDDPSPNDPAQNIPYRLFITNKRKYKQNIQDYILGE